VFGRDTRKPAPDEIAQKIDAVAVREQKMLGISGPSRNEFQYPALVGRKGGCHGVWPWGMVAGSSARIVAKEPVGKLSFVRFLRVSFGAQCWLRNIAALTLLG
jgi:hypothetical protein